VSGTPLQTLFPIALEMQGFYNSVYQKTIGKSLGQIARAALWLAFVLTLCMIFFKLQVPSRSVVVLFAASATRDLPWCRCAYIR